MFSKNIYLRCFQYGLIIGVSLGLILAGYTFYIYLSKPDFNLNQLQLTDRNENQFNLASRKGIPIVLNFLSRGCAPCIHELPIFESAVKRYQDSIQFYFIMDEDKEGLESFRKK